LDTITHAGLAGILFEVDSVLHGIPPITPPSSFCLDKLKNWMSAVLPSAETVSTLNVLAGYISQSDLRLHFGLGNSSKAEKIVIRWPSGLVETLSDLPANQYYVVREGSGVDKSKTLGVSQVRIQVSPAKCLNSFLSRHSQQK
jgi:hypothetical protein